MGFPEMIDVLNPVPPSVTLLQWLAGGSLKQNFLPAIRRWVWLRLLYGDEDTRLPLGDAFTYADWRHGFFSDSHPAHDEAPELHDPACPCAKPTVAWLFHPEVHLKEPQWQQYRLADQNQQTLQGQMEQFQQSLAEHNCLPGQLPKLLYEERLFGFTRRTLYRDLRVLTEMGWLDQQGKQFTKVETWPDLPQPELSDAWASKTEVSFLTQPDLAAIAENLTQPLGGSRRFFVHVDYIISRQKLDRVDDWQALLVDLWQREPVPPVTLSYQPAGSAQPVSVVVYPVCIYYYRRGPYLCAFGTVPQAPTDTLDWRNYRLDRILSMTPMSWDAAEIPPALQQRFQHQTLPTPDEIEIAIDDAWGFDYYQPAQQLFLRFDPLWDTRYIQGTKRHTTFEKVSHGEVLRYIQRHLQGDQQQQMLAVLHQRSPQDAYYQATFRQHDPNVRQRLRAWRPHVEVLLPWDLR